MSSKDNPVVVSVFSLVYNQEKYVTQMIEGVLRQKTRYPFELVIGDDASTDKTLEICRSFQKQFPVKISLIESEKNTGLIQNFLRTYKHCSGKYIAICDGDDYWIDPEKLDKQADFLEKNPDFSIVFGQKKDLWPDGSLTLDPREDIPDVTDFSDLVRDNYIASVSCMFRNNKKNTRLPAWMESLPYGDWPLYLMNIANGEKILYVRKPVAVYRKGIGQSAKLRNRLSETLKVKEYILDNLLEEPGMEPQRQEIMNSRYAVRQALIRAHNREGAIFKGWRLFIECLFEKPNGRLVKMYLSSLFKQRSVS